MPTYATAADCTAYIDGLVIDDAPAFDRLIERAERDVDRVLGPYPRQDATGLKWDLTWLLPWQTEALARAVAAQVEYLLTVKPEDVVGGRLPQSVKGPDFEVTYADGATNLPRIGARVAHELEPLAPLIRARGARAVA